MALMVLIDGTDGIDGTGPEFIWWLGAEDAMPPLPNNDWDYDAPQNGWTDGASGTTEALPFEWLSQRMVMGFMPVTNWTAPVIVFRYAVGEQGPRNRGDFYCSFTGNAWSDSRADQCIMESTGAAERKITDTVTLSDIDNDFIETRAWNGSDWITIDIRLDGNLLFPGSVTANKITVDSLTALGIRVQGDVEIEGTISADHITSDVRNARVLWNGNQYVDDSPTVDFTLSDSLNNWEFLLIEVVATHEGYAGVLGVPVDLIPINESSFVNVDTSDGVNRGRVSYFTYQGDAGPGGGVHLHIWRPAGSNLIRMRSRSTDEGVIRSIIGFKNPVEGSETTTVIPRLDIENTAISILEGNTATLRVKLTSEPTGNVTVAFSETDSDISLNPTNVQIFTPSNWDTYKEVIITALEDVDFDNDVAFIGIALSGSGTSDTGSVTVTIIDDDTPTDILLDVEDTTLTVNEDGAVNIRVRLTEQPSSNVLVTASESDADISVNPSTRLFTPQNWNGYQTFTVFGVQDADTVNDTATVILTATGGSIDTESIVITIIDNTPAPINTYTFTDQSAESVPGSMQILLNIANPPALPSAWVGSGTPTFRWVGCFLNTGGIFCRVNNGDLASGRYALIFEHGGSRLTTIRDGVLATLAGTNWTPGNPTQVQTFFNGINDGDPVMVTFTDDPSLMDGLVSTTSTPLLDVENTTLTVDEDGTVNIRVKLTEQPSSNVLVTASESDADISVTPSTRTFTPQNWNVYQTFTVSGVQDADMVNDTATVILTATGGSIDTESISITIIDVDSITPPPITPVEGTHYVYATVILPRRLNPTFTWSNATSNFPSDGRQAQIEGALTPQMLAIFRSALATWEAICNVSFNEVADSAGNDMRIGLYTPASPNTLAVETSFSALAGTIQNFSSILFSSIQYDPSTTGLLQVAAHEIGHFLGLSHCGATDQLMNPFFLTLVLISNRNMAI